MSQNESNNSNFQPPRRRSRSVRRSEPRNDKVTSDQSPGRLTTSDSEDSNEEPLFEGQGQGVKLKALKLKTGHPNVRVAAFLLVKTYQSQCSECEVSNRSLTTTANLAVLHAWNKGLCLTDLDRVKFSVEVHDDIPVLVLSKNEKQIMVPVVSRRFKLEKPYGGKWAIDKTSITS